MRANRLGCLTSAGILATLVVTLAIVGSAFASGGLMFSPGPLNAEPGKMLGGVSSHADIAGDCKACHAAPWEADTMDGRCSTCHVDVAAEMTDPASIHGKMQGIDPNAKCSTCHPEHKGSAAILTVLEGWRFPHEVALYSLKGHQLTVENEPFLCVDCHGNDVTQFDQLTCQGCHINMDMTFMADHQVVFGENCLACHDGVDRFGDDFDHNQFTFKLNGKHTPVPCGQCHLMAHTVAVLQTTSQDCFSCHQMDDPHKGSLGPDCASCHSPDGWKPSSFDHRRSEFKLDGSHVNVTCDKCHATGVFKGTPRDCFSCHSKDDKHNGIFGTDCAACHTPDEWNRTVDHSKFAFHLEGKHANVACESCHQGGVFKGTPMDCASCHSKDDAHAGQLGDQCGSCHTPNDWTSASFDHNSVSFTLTAHQTKSDGTAFACKDCHIKGYAAPFDQTSCANCHLQINQPFATEHILTFWTDCMACHDGVESHGKTFNHNQVPFNLIGRHALTACSKCHVNARKLADLKAAPQNCFACHAKDDKHNGQYGTNCAACHAPDGWNLAKVDHATFAFHLDGKHAAVACESCHQGGVFKGTPMDCASCHTKDDAHAGTLGMQCGTCHVPDGWKPAKVDHSKFTFQLEGKHMTAACESCHINGVFKGTPMDCVSCHSKDDAHAGTLGTQCGTCHMPDGWKPAKVDHSKFAFHLEGKHMTAACENCHINGVFKGTPMDCASCHSKDDAHAGTLGMQCGTCHVPNGWSLASFDHNKVSFSLTAHQTKPDGTAFACKDCHIKGYAAPFDQTSCANCHLQINQPFATEHILTFWTDCMACHDGVESHGKTFNHNQAPFNLIGRHALAACSKCHVNARKLADLKAASQDCFACHAKGDKHNGQYGTNCAACHASDGWNLAKVDHATFVFHLDGKHAAVACESCHQGGVFKGTPKDCASCHAKTEPHTGKLGTQCDSCHTVNGWIPSTFDHSRSAFLLTGKHTTMACSQCHADKLFVGTPQSCAACHGKTEPHAGKLGTQCDSCHTTNGWIPSTFDHNRSTFLLTGNHAAVACNQCHTNKLFVGTPTDCASCHSKNDPHSNLLGSQCANCHATSGWKPSSFNHVNSIFKLTGKHTTVACGQCHTDLKFKGTPTLCYTCHVANDRHGGKYGTNCSACHSTTAWKPATFDHNLSAFPLTGAHVSVACTSCHANGVFVGTPKDCYSCHKAKDPHVNKAGTDCATCHTTTAWKPSTFKHTFPLTHGNNPIVACATCHPSSTSAYTCFSCHEHTITNIADKHKEVRDYSQATCAQCHANGHTP